jgi:hypothetical protein
MRGRARGKLGTCNQMLRMLQMPKEGCFAFSRLASHIRVLPSRGKSPLCFAKQPFCTQSALNGSSDAGRSGAVRRGDTGDGVWPVRMARSCGHAVCMSSAVRCAARIQSRGGALGVSFSPGPGAGRCAWIESVGASVVAGTKTPRDDFLKGIIAPSSAATWALLCWTTTEELPRRSAMRSRPSVFLRPAMRPLENTPCAVGTARRHRVGHSAPLCSDALRPCADSRHVNDAVCSRDALQPRRRAGDERCAVEQSNHTAWHCPAQRPVTDGIRIRAAACCGRPWTKGRRAAGADVQARLTMHYYRGR